MYRTRKFRKNGGTIKKKLNTKSRKRKNPTKRQSKKARGTGLNSTTTDEFGREHREWGSSEASPRTMRRLRGQFGEASDLMDQYGEASPTQLELMRPRRKSKTRNKKLPIALTGTALLTIAALLANSKDASTPVPPPPPVKFEEAQSQILKSIDMRLKEKDVSNAQRENMKEASDILRLTPSQGRYNNDPSIKAKRKEAIKRQEKQYKADMATLARRRDHPKGPKPIPGRLQKKYQPKPLKLA